MLDAAAAVRAHGRLVVLGDDAHRRGGGVDDEQAAAAQRHEGEPAALLDEGQIGALSGRSAASWQGAPFGVVQAARSSVAAASSVKVLVA